MFLFPWEPEQQMILWNVSIFIGFPYFIIQIYGTQNYKQSKGGWDDEKTRKKPQGLWEMKFPLNIQDWMSYLMRLIGSTKTEQKLKITTEKD